MPFPLRQIYRGPTGPFSARGAVQRLQLSAVEEHALRKDQRMNVEGLAWWRPVGCCSRESGNCHGIRLENVTLHVMTRLDSDTSFLCCHSEQIAVSAEDPLSNDLSTVRQVDHDLWRVREEEACTLRC